MLVLILLLHHVLGEGGEDSPKPLKYVIKDIASCPDEGFLFQQDLQSLEELQQPPGRCQLCFCEEGSRAVCWERDAGKCDLENHHVGRRALRQYRNPKRYLYDGKDSTMSKNTLDQEDCSHPGKVFNVDCPPDDWCSGCTVCDCLSTKKWKCTSLNICDDDILNKKLVKRNIYRLLTDSTEKNYTSSKAIFHKAKKDRVIKVQHEKEIHLPDEVHSKTKQKINMQHTKEILEQKKISAKKKGGYKGQGTVAKLKEKTTPSPKNSTRSKMCKQSAIQSYKSNKSNKTVSILKDNKNNTLRKEMSQAKKLFMNTKHKNKKNKQSKRQNKSLQETHKLSVRHISIHSEKHKSRIAKRHDSKTYLESLSDKNSKVLKEKLFFKLAYCDDSKGRLARRRRDADEVAAEDIVTLSNETASDLYIAVPEDESSNASTSNKTKNSTTHYFAYKIVDPKKDYKTTRAAKDFYFPFIDGLDNVINKLNALNQMMLPDSQQKSTSDTDAMLDQFEQLHGIEDSILVAHLNRTKLNFSMQKKLSGKDIVRKLKLKSRFYKTLKELTKKHNDTTDAEIRNYIISILSLINQQGYGHAMLRNHKRLNALKFLRELLKSMFYKKQYNQTQTNYEREILDLMCSNFGPCLIEKENEATIKSNSKVLYMEVIKMLRIVKIIKGLLNHVEQSKCVGKPEFSCDIHTLNAVMKKRNENITRTHEEDILLNSVRQNTRSFVRSVEHFVVIFNNLLCIVTKNGTVVRQNTVPDSNNNATRQIFKKLKHLIALYRLSENHFLKSVVAAIPAERNISTEKFNQTEISAAYTMDIMSKLRKLKNLAEAIIDHNKQRPKRSLDFDADVVEYLLNVMEYIVKQNSPRDQVTDGIDLLLDTIRRSTTHVRPKKKFLYPLFAPKRTTTMKPDLRNYEKVSYNNVEIDKKMEPNVGTEVVKVEEYYITDKPRSATESKRFTTPYPNHFLDTESIKQKGETEPLVSFDKKLFKKVNDNIVRGKSAIYRIKDDGNPKYVPMRTTTKRSLTNNVELGDALNLGQNIIDYEIDEIPFTTNKTVNITPISLIYNVPNLLADRYDNSSFEEDAKISDKVEEESDEMLHEESEK